MGLISRSVTLNIWFKQLPSSLQEQFQWALHLANVPQHLYFSLNELPRSPRRILSHKNNPWLTALGHVSSHYYLKNNLVSEYPETQSYSEEGILDVKRNTEHKIQSNVETTRLVERRRECSQQVHCLFQHFVGEWWSKTHSKSQSWALERRERCCMFSIKTFMIKLHGGLWEIMRFESSETFSKLLGPWQCQPGELSKNTLFYSPWESGSCPQQPLRKSYSALIFQGCWVQAASTGTLVEQFELAASWDPLVYQAAPCATKEHPLCI